MKFLIATNDQADGPGTEPFGYLRALQSLEHETDLFYYRKKSFLYSNIRSTWIRQMNARLVKRVQTWNPDVLLVFRGGYITADSIESINRTTSCVTVNFYPDNPFGLASYDSKIAAAAAANSWQPRMMSSSFVFSAKS